MYRGVVTTDDISDVLLKTHSIRVPASDGSMRFYYSCTYENCRQRNMDFAGLRRHLRKHFNVKPFHCAYCNYKTARKHNTVMHIHRKHPDCTQVPHYSTYNYS